MFIVGRKAAHWVRSENPELFNHRECDPPIESFFPKVVYTEESEVTEDDLVKVIDRNEVSDAMLVYTNLKNKGLELVLCKDQSNVKMSLVTFRS